MCEALRELMKEDFEKHERETKLETLLEAIRNLMETMKCSADQAMAALKIPDDDKGKYIAKLQKWMYLEQTEFKNSYVDNFA